MRPSTSSIPRSQRGFTLVEMAVVLAVIGLVLGAVMIGKDVQRNAEYTKIKQKFVDQWAVAYNAYYQRTGVPVGDSQVRPQLMVNGQGWLADTNNTASGGDMTNASSPGEVCADTQAVNLRELMLRAGVEMPPGRAEGFEDRYVYLDSNGNPQEIKVCFRWNPPGTDSGAGNVMVISGLTPDLARFLDQSVDGQADAQEGVFREAGITASGDNQPGSQWGANNTYAMDASNATGTGDGSALDESQIITVTAHYKMNQ